MRGHWLVGEYFFLFFLYISTHDLTERRLNQALLSCHWHGSCLARQNFDQLAGDTSALRCHEMHAAEELP